MPAAYSLDLRTRILADTDRGLTTRAVATKYTVSESWVRRLKQRRRETGEVAPRTATPGPKPSWDAYADRLRAAVADTPDATLEELRDRLALTVALSTLWRAVAALGLSVKKKSAGRPSRTGRTSRPSGSSGGRTSRPSTRTASCSSMRRGPART
jgi:transposase